MSMTNVYIYGVALNLNFGKLNHLPTFGYYARHKNIWDGG